MAQVTPKQVTLFAELVERKEFPEGTDTDALKSQFETLTRKDASSWIDRALSLPNAADADEDGAEPVPAPF